MQHYKYFHQLTYRHPRKDYPDKQCQNCGRLMNYEQYRRDHYGNSLSQKQWLSRKYCGHDCKNKGIHGHKVEYYEPKESAFPEHSVDREIIDMILLREEVRDMENDVNNYFY